MDLSAVPIGSNMVQLTWPAPPSKTPPVSGYEVFYTEFGVASTQSGGITSNTTINVTLPILGVTYELFVVAFSDAPNTLIQKSLILAWIEKVR